MTVKFTIRDGAYQNFMQGKPVKIMADSTFCTLIEITAEADEIITITEFNTPVMVQRVKVHFE